MKNQNGGCGGIVIIVIGVFLALVLFAVVG